MGGLGCVGRIDRALWSLRRALVILDSETLDSEDKWALMVAV